MNREVDDAATRHEYSGARAFRSRPEILRQFCRGKTVLHVGCVDVGFYVKHLAEQRFLHDDLVDVAKEVWGIDIDTIGVQQMTADGYSNIHVIDITEERGRLEVKRFLGDSGRLDIVLCGEVIEHVPNPVELVRGLVEVSRLTGAEIIITTPNPFYWGRFVEALLRRETVHPDHNAYLSAANLEAIARKVGGSTKVECDFYLNPASSRLRRLVKHGVSRVLPCLSDGVIARFRAATAGPGHAER